MADNFFCHGYEDEVPFDEIPPEPGREIRNERSGGITIKVKQDNIVEQSDDEISFTDPKSSDGNFKRTIKNDKVENIKLQIANNPSNNMTRSKSIRRTISERLGPPVKRTKTVILREAKASSLRANKNVSVISDCRIGPPSKHVNRSRTSICQNKIIPSSSKNYDVHKQTVPYNKLASDNKRQQCYKDIPNTVIRSKAIPRQPSKFQPNKTYNKQKECKNNPVRSAIVPKVKNTNPISKAKGRATVTKTNLSKNISSLTKTKNNTKEASDKTSGVIADLIQNILDEPDIKNIISTLAEQSVSPDVFPSHNSIHDQIQPYDSVPGPSDTLQSTFPRHFQNSYNLDNSQQFYSNSSCNPHQFNDHYNKHQFPEFPNSSSPMQHFVKYNKALEQNAQQILNNANNVLIKGSASLQTSHKPFVKREVPKMKIVHAGSIKFSLYCKLCKQLFPTEIMRDMHKKSELHLFVSQEWWKIHPPHPVKIPRSKFPVKIFCIGCWDRITCDTQDQIKTHIDCKRHKKNQNKFAETFGKPPLYQWCFWDSLSDNFRNVFVPPPPKMRAVLQPEYMYEQRYQLK